MNFRTKSYLRKRFGDYYQTSELPLPHDFKRREWGFIFFDELPEVVMRRHKAFSSEGEAIEYLRGMVPAHVYHSAAYYQFPGAGTMKEKKWEGADLIFDLDADHLPQKAKSYAGMLANVKGETGKLLDFLLEDFGFDEENIRVAFSGGRGYHIHVHDPRVLTLESAERREIVDYIGGVGVDKDFMFRDYSIGKQFEMYIEGTKGTTHERRIKVGGGTTKRIVTFENIPGGYGWGKRVSQYLIQFLRNISMKDNTDANNEISNILMNYYLKEVSTDEMQEDIVKQIIQLKKDKLLLEEIVHNVRVPIEKVRKILITNDLWNFKQDATKKLNILLKISQSSEALDLIKNKGIVDFKGVPEFFEIILQNTIEEFGIKLGAKTDEPVTADIRRLIRMPSSLHGGSGMRVVPLTLAGFKEFEPLRDAVVFSEKEINIEVIPPLKPQNALVEMKGKSIKVVEGINIVPEYAGIYLMCRGAAEYA